MKKLNKLIINPEKVIKNEELVNLRGGYDGICTTYCHGTNIVIQSPYHCAYEECPYSSSCDCD